MKNRLLRSPCHGMSIPKTYVTFNGLAKRLPLPVATASRRLRERGIVPDAVTVESGEQPSQLLFAVERLPELRSVLLPKKHKVNS